MLIQIKGKHLHYEESGSGNPILFVHGWGGSLKSLYPLYRLAATSSHAYIIDLPGFGESDYPGPDWGIEEYADIVARFIHIMDISPVAYFGHSFGGSIGIYLSANNPQLIHRLVLCDSSYKRDIKKSQPRGLVRAFSRFKVPLLKKIFYKIFYPDSDLLKFPHLEANFRKIVTQDLTPLVEKIPVQTLILWGETDGVTPVAWAYELKEKIAKSQLKVFPNIGHALPLKHPDIVYDELKKFL